MHESNQKKLLVTSNIITKYVTENYMTLNPFHSNGLFLWPLKTQKTFSFLIYFRDYKKSPVSWNGLEIFSTNMSAQCWYSDLFHNRARFLMVCIGYWSMQSRGIQFQFRLISRNTSQSLLQVDVYDNQLKQ